MRLLYHTEEQNLCIAEPEILFFGEYVDVSDDPKYRKLAMLDGLDLDEIAPIEQFVVIDENGERDVPVEKFMEIKHGSVAGAIAASMQKWARKPADLYPTPADCVYSLLPHIAHLVPANALVLEPACADGQMVDALREFGWEVDGTDLRPDVKGGIGGMDFLSNETYFPDDYYDILATNPPFTCAEAFIRRALQVAPVVVMLLKAQYWNTKNRKALFRETKPYAELNLTWRPAFLAAERGNSPLMDCMWVVWVRGHTGDCTTTMIDRLMECPVNVGHMDFGGL